MTPRKVPHTVLIYIDAIVNKQKDCRPKTLPKSNLSSAEKISSQNLQLRYDFIITKADKDGALIICNVEDYVSEEKDNLITRRTLTP